MKIEVMDDNDSKAEPDKFPKFLTLFATPWSDSDVRSAIELTQKYIELIGVLKILSDRFSEGDDRLDVALQMLVEVKHFIEQDTSVAQYGMTEPLGAIATALRDIQQGIPPKLFQEKIIKNKTKYKDPTLTMAVSACAAACMEILMRYKYGQEKSGLFVAIELSKFGITHTHEGRTITQDTIRRWRDRMNVKNKTVAMAIYEQIIAGMVAQLGNAATLQNVKLLVRRNVRELANSGTVLRVPKPYDPSLSSGKIDPIP